MEITMSTPALLFPTISVLMLAYTNRFIAISRLARELHEKYQKGENEIMYSQLRVLRKRLLIIRNMQAIAISGFLCCILSMFMIYLDIQKAANIFFVTSLSLLGISLIFSITEIFMSGRVIMLQLDQDIEKESRFLRTKTK